MKKTTKKKLDHLFASLGMATTAILSCLAHQKNDDEVIAIMSRLKERIDIGFDKILNK